MKKNMDNGIIEVIPRVTGYEYRGHIIREFTVNFDKSIVSFIVDESTTKDFNTMENARAFVDFIEDNKGGGQNDGI